MPKLSIIIGIISLAIRFCAWFYVLAMKKLKVTISYMERSVSEPVLSGEFGENFTLRHERGALGELHREFYYSVGLNNFWWERRLWNDEQWQELATDTDVELWGLYEGETAAGFFELSFANLLESAELSFFGLCPSYIGKGLGRVLLSKAVQRLEEKFPIRILVDTCDLDHEAAKPLYESFGFRQYKVVARVIEDPRHTGVLPADLPLPKNFTRSQ